jgi:antitoxin component of RelBE/YafQ-DinJ toxin-antitoxin module
MDIMQVVMTRINLREMGLEIMQIMKMPLSLCLEKRDLPIRFGPIN